MQIPFFIDVAMEEAEELFAGEFPFNLQRKAK